MPGMLTHVFDSSTQEAQAGKSCEVEAQLFYTGSSGQLELHSKSLSLSETPS